MTDSEFSIDYNVCKFSGLQFSFYINVLLVLLVSLVCITLYDNITLVIVLEQEMTLDHRAGLSAVCHKHHKPAFERSSAFPTARD